MSQVIAQSKISHDFGRCHGEQDGRIDVEVFANFIVGKDKSMVKFSFRGVLALYLKMKHFAKHAFGFIYQKGNLHKAQN